MFLFNLILNCLLFTVVMFLTHWLQRREDPVEFFRPRRLLLPVTLGLALTIVDSLRLAFIQELLLFLIFAAVIFWFFKVFLSK